jgi:hypothetical protein
MTSAGVGGAANVSYKPVLWNWFAHYAAMYAGVRGGMRMKIQIAPIPTSANSTLPLFRSVSVYQVNEIAAPYVGVYNGIPYLGSSGLYLDYVNGLDMPGGVVLGNDVVSNGAEFTFPNYDQFKFRNVSPYTVAFPSAVAATVKAVCVEIVASMVSGTTNASYNVMIYQAGSSDITPVFFRRVPMIT